MAPEAQGLLLQNTLIYTFPFHRFDCLPTYFSYWFRWCFKYFNSYNIVTGFPLLLPKCNDLLCIRQCLQFTIQFKCYLYFLFGSWVEPLYNRKWPYKWYFCFMVRDDKKMLLFEGCKNCDREKTTIIDRVTNFIL